MPFFDFHTHDLLTPPGRGIVCLPRRIVMGSEAWKPHPHGRYAAGIHPWWTADPDFVLEVALDGLRQLLRHRQVEQLGECGFDRLKGASGEVQQQVFEAQVELSETLSRPMTLHVVRAFDLILAARKRLRPTQIWTIHGFRGHPALARQLLAAGFHLSFGKHRHPEAFAITPPDRRYEETDDNPQGEE